LVVRRLRESVQRQGEYDMSLAQVFDITSVTAPAAPNRTTAARPYKDVGGVPITLSDGTIVLALLSVPAGSSASVLTNVASSASSGVLLAANPARKGCIIFNDSTATLYIAYAPTCSATAYTYQIASQQTFESPSLIYQGIISGVWASANGYARITELT
jgi:hypothetical protein